jgi:hypothetical protein
MKINHGAGTISACMTVTGGWNDDIEPPLMYDTSAHDDG